jgi:hypothetical protein
VSAGAAHRLILEIQFQSIAQVSHRLVDRPALAGYLDFEGSELRTSRRQE